MMDLWVIKNLAPLFYNVVELSMAAVCIGLGVLLLRKFADKRIPPIWKNALWLLVLVALVVPYRPSSNVAVIPSTEVNFRQQETSLHTEITEQKTQLDGVYEAPSELVTQREELHAKSLIFEVVIPAIWLLGMVIMMGILLATRQKMLKNLRSDEGVAPYDVLLDDCKRQLNITQTVEIVEQSYLKSPALYGLFHPKILLPDYVSEMSEDSQKYILLHELSHLKHHDLWKTTLLLALQIVYWFNPLVWVLFRFIRQDMELLNDERVLKTLEKSEETPYAMSLIEVLGHSNKLPLAPQMLCMVDNKENTKRRIQMIQLGEVFKKHKIIIAVGCLAVIAVLSALFLTKPVIPSPPQTPWENSVYSPSARYCAIYDSILDNFMVKIRDDVEFTTILDREIHLTPTFFWGAGDVLAVNYGLQNGENMEFYSSYGCIYTFHNNEYTQYLLPTLDEINLFIPEYSLSTELGLTLNTQEITGSDTATLLFNAPIDGTSDCLAGEIEFNFIENRIIECTNILVVGNPQPPTSNEPQPLLDLANDPNVTIVDYVSMDDMAYGKVGIVCYTEQGDDTNYISYLTQEYGSRTGIVAGGQQAVLPESKLIYLGDGICEITLQNIETGEPVVYTIEYWIDDMQTNFKVSSSDSRPTPYGITFTADDVTSILSVDDSEIIQQLLDITKDSDDWTASAVEITPDVQITSPQGEILMYESESGTLVNTTQNQSVVLDYEAKIGLNEVLGRYGTLESSSSELVGDPRLLTADQLAYFNDTYFNGATGQNWNIANQFLHNPFDLPINIDLFMLFYLGTGTDYAMSEDGEYDAVAQAYGFDSWAEMPTDVTPIPKASMDDMLEQYTGIDLFATNKVGLDNFKYLEEYDCYYNLHGDTNYYGTVEFVWGYQRGDRISLSYYNGLQQADYILTLVDYGGENYKIYSNLPATIEE